LHTYDLEMSGSLEWVLLAYRLPREPSAPRVTVWRKLRRLGVVQVVDGLVGLPADARTREQLEWMADEVLEAGGEATVWLARLGSAAQERLLAERMASAVEADYRAVTSEALDAEAADEAVRRRTLGRLRRELQRIGRRDFFPPEEGEAAHRAVESLARTLVTR
jgi:hypothetical protein